MGGFETWESYDKFNDSSHAPMERLGYGLKGLSTGSQALVFVAQFTLNLFSRLGAGSIGAIVATWMLTALMVTGIVYLIGVIIINVFNAPNLRNGCFNLHGVRSRKIGTP
ncbi:hypothetical protein [Vibrio sp. C8]